MAYTRKTWVNVPDPDSYNGDIPLSDLPRYDADNMNRIEDGVDEALKLATVAVPALRRLDGDDVLEINSEGLYYIYNAVNVPTGVKSGYIHVEYSHTDYKVVYWRPYNSQTEYTNVKADGVWYGWTETFTNQGGTINGYLANYSAITPGIYFYANKCFAQIIKNASDDIDLGILISDFADKEDGNSSANLILSHLKAKDSLKDALQFAYVEDGKAQYFNVFGEHNKPSGIYTGTCGSVTGGGSYLHGGQTIDTGGTGYALIITTESGAIRALVMQGGALIFGNDSVEINTNVTFSNGQLRIPQDNRMLDSLNSIYRWYCL